MTHNTDIMDRPQILNPILRHIMQVWEAHKSVGLQSLSKHIMSFLYNPEFVPTFHSPSYFQM